MKEEDKKIIKEAVYETLIGLGFDAKDPIEMQKNMIFLNRMRLGSEATKRNIIKAIVTVTIPTLCYLLWETFKIKIGN